MSGRLRRVQTGLDENPKPLELTVRTPAPSVVSGRGQRGYRDVDAMIVSLKKRSVTFLQVTRAWKDLDHADPNPVMYWIDFDGLSLGFHRCSAVRTQTAQMLKDDPRSTGPQCNGGIYM